MSERPREKKAPVGATKPRKSAPVIQPPPSTVDTPRVSLERVIGNTVVRSAALATNATTGELAFIAGSVVVIYNPRTGRQSRFLSSNPSLLASVVSDGASPPSPLSVGPASRSRALTCVAFGPSGRHVAAGEAGRSAAVHVWDAVTGNLLASLRGAHANGVSCVAFSPNQRLLVSAGGQGDCLCMWDIRAAAIVAQAKTGALIHAVSFSEDGTFFVTAGHKHLKYWYVDQSSSAPAPASSSAAPGPVPFCVPGAQGPRWAILEGKSVALGGHRESTFIDVSCGRGSSKGCVHAVTFSGTLYGFNSGRQMEKWVDLRSHVFALTSSEKYVGCACADGNIRLFHPTSLNYMMTLPKPHPLGRNLVAEQQVRQSPTNVYPDAVACRLLTGDSKIACCYSDRSLYIWSIETNSKIVKYRSFLSHSASIWDISVAPFDRTAKQARADAPAQAPTPAEGLPPGTFATSSADGTVRFWNIDGTGPRNIYSKDMVHLVNVSDTAGQAGRPVDDYERRDFSAVAVPSPTVKAKDKEKDKEKKETGVGFCCVAFRPDGRHLALGDKQGNLKVLDTKTTDLFFERPAHAAEVLAMDFSKPATDDEPFLLATAGRDRLVHIFNAGSRSQPGVPYSLLHTLSEHASPITAIKFAFGCKRLFTCSTDNEVIFRTVELQPFSARQYQTALIPAVPDAASSSAAPAELSARVFSMAIDPTEKYLVTGQDKKLCLLSTANGKVSRNWRTDGAGAIVKVEIDPAGLHVATSSADKLVRLYDIYTGENIAKFGGHSEFVTSIKFTPDCRRIISVSGDGCIFVWALDGETTKAMLERLQENASTPRIPPATAAAAPSTAPAAAAPVPAIPIPAPSGPGAASPAGSPRGPLEDGKHDESMYMIQASDTQLPSWAKGHKKGDAAAKGRPSAARGAWAQKVIDPAAFIDAAGEEIEFLNIADPAAKVPASAGPQGDVVEEDVSDGELSVTEPETEQRQFEVSVKTGAEAEEEVAPAAEAPSSKYGPPVSPKVLIAPEDAVDVEEDDLLESALESLNSPKVDMLRKSISADFLGQLRTPLQQAGILPGGPGAVMPPANPVKYTFVAEGSGAGEMLCPIAGLLAPPDAAAAAAAPAAPAGTVASPSGVPVPTAVSPPAKPPSRTPHVSPVEDPTMPVPPMSQPIPIQQQQQQQQPQSKADFPSHSPPKHTKPPSRTHTPKTGQSPDSPQMKDPTPPDIGEATKRVPRDRTSSMDGGPKMPHLEHPSSKGRNSPVVNPLPGPDSSPPGQGNPIPAPSEATKDSFEKIATGLRAALSDAFGLCQAAKEQTRKDVEEELRSVLESVRQEIGKFLAGEKSPAGSKPLTEATLEAAFDRYSRTLMAKIDEHIETTLEAAIARRASPAGHQAAAAAPPTTSPATETTVVTEKHEPDAPV